jgi:threonine/homoserine/homoserine lactone efflux protein
MYDINVNPSLLSFVAISAIVIASPGPDTALTIRNALLGGRAAGILTTSGIVTGQAIWALAASAGIVSILIASEALFRGVQIAGALYLIWLGAQSLYRACRRREPLPAHSRALSTVELSRSPAFRQGLISNLANPKMAVFFASILPQFARESGPIFAQLIALGLVFCTMTFAWLSLYAVLVSKMRDVFTASRVRRVLEGLTGAALLTLGWRLATSER